jgi:hypothetical protein
MKGSIIIFMMVAVLVNTIVLIFVACCLINETAESALQMNIQGGLDELKRFVGVPVFSVLSFVAVIADAVIMMMGISACRNFDQYKTLFEAERELNEEREKYKQATEQLIKMQKITAIV